MKSEKIPRKPMGTSKHVRVVIDSKLLDAKMWLKETVESFGSSFTL